MKLKLFVALIIAAFVAGCGDSKDEAAGGTNGYSSPIKGTAAGRVVEDMTGYTDVKAEKRAAATIKAVSTQERKDYNDAADMNKPQ
jgi:hypothetical protein